MRRIIISLLSLSVLLTAPPARAEDPHASGKFGVGVVAGYPDLGLSLNAFLTDTTSLQINPVASIGEDPGFGGRLDWLFWPSTIASSDALDVDWFIGPGANFYAGEWGFGLGAELPVGIGLAFQAVPIDLNLEAVPILHLIDDDGVNPGFGIAGALNARYYF